MMGYRHPGYAAALAEFGEPWYLPGCDGHVLVRHIGDSSWRDAMGPYPLFSCRDWKLLAADVDALRGDLVSLSIVADPFGDYECADLARTFETIIPFKDHYVVDLERPPGSYVSRHHRYYARRALKNLEVEVCEQPADFVSDWSDLYQQLILRHRIKGIQAFSRESFARQLKVPGMVAIKVREKNLLVGAHLWYVDGAVAYSHLAASSIRGYQLGCHYAAYACALEHFRSRTRWLDLGAGAGVRSSNDGLTRFKEGWATGTRTAYFCGAVLNDKHYSELVATRSAAESAYFPAYRTGERD
jgi:hypothetical protein